METDNLTIEELDAFFATRKLPKEIELHTGVKISDVPLFVESHIRTYKNNRQSRVYDIFRVRLMKLRKLLIEENRQET